VAALMNNSRVLFVTLAAFMGIISASDSYGASTRVEAGRDIAQTHCARCHGIGRADESALEMAPPFRRLHDRYPVEQLAEALAEGIVVGHKEMPPFEFSPDDIQALLAYLKSLDSSRP
jgi:cytochrome c